MCRFALVVEAASDARTATTLADRVLAEQIEDAVDQQRTWLPALTWTEVARLRKAAGRKLHGHFGGEPGLPDAKAARSAMVELLAANPQPDAIVLIRDLDDLGSGDRRTGLDQARREHVTHHPDIPVVIGVAIPKREAWILAGFSPSDAEERRALAIEIRRLGRDPTRKPHELRARTHGAKTDIKAVFAALAIDVDPELRCLSEPSLADLRGRGEHTGLPEFLDEVMDQLVPLL